MCADFFRSLAEDSKPVQVAEDLEIMRKPKALPASEPLAEPSVNGKPNGATNGTYNGSVNGISNGTPIVDEDSVAGTKRKRSIGDTNADPRSAQKLRKVASLSNDPKPNGVDSVLIEDSADGAIVIDDD